MKLPPPFDNASDVQTDAHGSISLVDQQGKSLARIPMTTAFELSPEAEGDGYGGHGFNHGDGSGYGSCDGYGYGSCDGYGDGCGDGYGDDVGDGDGSGKSK